MGYDLFDELNTMAHLMVNAIINPELAGCVYLILCHPNEPKSSHMLLLIDLLGSSDETNVSGFMVHLTAITSDGHYPHFTKLQMEGWSFNRDRVGIITISNLSESIYLSDPSRIPTHVNPYHLSNVHQQINSSHIPVGMHRNLIDMMANGVYYDMIAQNNSQERWSSVLNCQQFVREFVTQALELLWPNIEVVGDALPLIIDLATICLSSKENMKKKTLRRD